MTAVSTIIEPKPEHQPATNTQEASALIQAIERVALNPNIEIDRMERLLAMQERIMASRSEQQFGVAMSDCQSEMKPVAADADNQQTKSKYATYGALDKALRPIYTKHGFALSFSDADSPKADHVRVVCTVRHRAGHKELHHKDMPADGKGAKGGDVMTKTHAAGAAQSYGMRYLLKGIFNIAIGEDDTDGNMPDDLLTNDQVTVLMDLAQEVNADRVKFLEYMSTTSGMRIEKLADIPAVLFNVARQALKAKAKKP